MKRFFLSVFFAGAAAVANAQYQGGSGPGFKSATASSLNLSAASMYSGGNNDGSGLVSALSFSLATGSSYSGGSNDGTGTATANALSISAGSSYSGGANDGSAIISASALSLGAPGMYSGGSDDGFQMASVTALNIGSGSSYSGGPNDGVSAASVSGLSLGTATMYTGGANDGSTLIASTSLALNPLSGMYTGGGNDGISVYRATAIPMVPGIMCLRTRMYVEGALMDNASASASDGRPLMRDNLRNSPFTGLNYIPVKDIYEFATPYVDIAGSYTKLSPQDASHAGFQQVTDSATVFGVSGQDAIVDWVFVELRSKNNNATVAATRAALLQRDGDVVEVDGKSCLSFPQVTVDSYYVAVRHRTHLGAMTRYAQSYAGLQTLVDFTIPATPLCDRGLVGVFDFTGLAVKENAVGTYRALWQGDFNQDGKIKYDNPDDDLSTLLFEVLFDPGNATFASNYDFAYGYRQGDYDMNSKAKYDTPDDDNALTLFQVLFYGQNSQFASNFDFMLQQLP